MMNESTMDPDSSSHVTPTVPLFTILTLFVKKSAEDVRGIISRPRTLPRMLVGGSIAQIGLMRSFPEISGKITLSKVGPCTGRVGM